MNTISLPDALQLNTEASIAIFNYQTRKEVSKQQILLNKNTFSFLQEGHKEVYFNNASYAINKNRFLLMKTGHCLMTEKLAREAHYYRSMLLFFSNEDVLSFIRKHQLNISKKTSGISTYSFTYDNFIQQFVQSLLAISKLSPTFQQKILPSKFEEIMLYLAEREGVGFLFSLTTQTSNQTQNFIQTVESNQLNKLTIKELAFLANMSISTFKREFKKHFNSPPSKWFQDKRLEHAAFLLQSPDKRPSDIFEEIGYESLSTFIQAFKLKFGITPKQYQSK